MKKVFLFLMVIGVPIALIAKGPSTGLEPIKLNQPNLERGKSLMHSLSERHSERNYSDKQLSLQDLSDLLWAANGINRPDGHRTAPSSMNKQDILLYVALPEGTYFYNHKTHILEPVSEGDHRQKIRGNMPALNIILVAAQGERETALMNVGYVAQNIYLVCTALDMATVSCRGSMDSDAFAKACKLKNKQSILLQHPVGYPKE
ncbi:MAG: SagB/ThcOx family dehydrogenase [Bacteroidales bacterium]|jgi:nitroreductase|nr:SagB/ThcOx family dehydrogenase [Bacteroidales bacterium]